MSRLRFFRRFSSERWLDPGRQFIVRAVSYYALNKFDKTIEASQKELTANPKDKQGRYHLSLALSASGRLFEQSSNSEALQTEDPQNLAVAYQLVVDYKAAAQQAGQNLRKWLPIQN